MAIPTYDNLFNPVIKALHELGGSGSVSEIDEKVAEILQLTEEEIAAVHIANNKFLETSAPKTAPDKTKSPKRKTRTTN